MQTEQGAAVLLSGSHQHSGRAPQCIRPLIGECGGGCTQYALPPECTPRAPGDFTLHCKLLLLVSRHSKISLPCHALVQIFHTHSTSMLCIEVMLLRDLPWARSCCAHHASLLRSYAERKLIAHAAGSSKCFNVHREHLCSAWSLNGLPGLMQARASLEHILQQEISEGKAGIADLRYTFLCSTTAMDTNKGCRLALTGYCLSRIKHHLQSFPLQLHPANCSVTAEYSSGHVRLVPHTA